MSRTESSSHEKAVSLLAANEFAYQRLCNEVARLHRQRNDKLLPMIESVARFAWNSHPGRLADGALENVLLEVGKKHDRALIHTQKMTTEPPHFHAPACLAQP